MRVMNDNIPVMEIPVWATEGDDLAHVIRGARELVELRVGFSVELAVLEPFERDGEHNLRVTWRPAAMASLMSPSAGAAPVGFVGL